MPIEDLRFNDRKQVKRMVAACQLEGAIIDMDKNGFFAHSFTMPAWLAALPTADQVEVSVGIQPKPERKVVRNVKNGACDAIRAWARANPEATKDEALAQFPDFNPSTVKIQLRKVRLGLV